MGLLKSMPVKENNQWPWNSEVSSDLYNTLDIEWPKITIVTPSYNQGQFIEETIRSIILQNYPNVEYIIMDGGSTDNTIEIIQKYKKWIDIVVSEKDKGQSDALVNGFAKSTGKILNWINSDDILCEKALFYIGKTFAENSELSFVYGKNGIMDINSELYSFVQHPKDILTQRYLCEMPYGQQACFFTREAYMAAGGVNRDIYFSMDYELYLRMHLLGIKVKQIDDLIGNIRIHDSTKTAQYEEIMHLENGNAFMTFLSSYGKHRYANFFKSIGHAMYPAYTIKLKLTNKEIKASFKHYLYKNVWYYYNNKRRQISKKIILRIFFMDPKAIFKLNYLKIFKDGFSRSF